MTKSALFLMLFTQISVTAITAYFFIKMLNTPKKSEPDSYSENDDE